MEIQKWRSMLERRGYEVEVWQEGNRIYYTIAGVARVSRPVSQFRALSYKEARRQIDQDLARGMRHAVHTCGLPLLYALAGYTCDYPFYRVEEPLRKRQYYLIPLYPNYQPVEICPQCGLPFDTKTVHRVRDED